MRRINFIFILFLAAWINVEAQNKVGFVVDITGTARLKNADGKEQKLTTQNFAVSLSVGQSLKADGKGKVQIKLCNGKFEIVGNKWRLITPILCSNPSGRTKESVLEKIFDIGARHKRGDDEFILFPIESLKGEKEEDIIRPKTAFFRWMPTSEKLTLEVYIVGKNKPEWRQEVDGKLRYFASPSLSRTLEEIRKKNPNAKLQLKIKAASLNTTNIANFRLFSLQDENNLDEELGQINDEQGVFRYLARAAIYYRYKLYSEMANEYEQALKLSPESIDLLNLAAAAQDRTGNFTRRDAIDNKIEALLSGKQ